MLQKDDLLTSEDIANMTLQEFIKFKRVKTYRSYPAQELLDANTDWLLIGDLENIKSIKDLRRLIIELKEDLWYKIKREKVED